LTGARNEGAGEIERPLRPLYYGGKATVDVATVIGVISGLSFIFFAMTLGGSGLAVYIHVPSLMITLGAGDVWKIGEQVLEKLKYGDGKH